jgi:hypothetical protein
MLERRIEKLEGALTPPGQTVGVVRHECESDEDIRQRVRAALGGDPRQRGVVLIVQTTHYGPCPPHPHVHEGQVQIWPYSR